MKNFLFGLIATVLFSATSSAAIFTNAKNTQITATKEQSQEVKIEFSYSNQKIVTTKSFNSLEEAQVFIEAEFEKMQAQLTSLENADEITCSATVHVGVPSNFIEVTVSGPCSEIAAIIKKLKAQLVALL